MIDISKQIENCEALSFLLSTAIPESCYRCPMLVKDSSGAICDCKLVSKVPEDRDPLCTTTDWDRRVKAEIEQIVNDVLGE